MNSYKYDFEDINNRLIQSVDTICSHFWSNGKKQGIYWVVGDVYNTKSSKDGSFKITLSGAKKGLFHDFNGDKHYSPLDALAALYSVDVLEAAKIASSFLGLSVEERKNLKFVKPQLKVKEPDSKNTILPKKLNVSWSKKLEQRLAKNEVALAYLYGRSLTAETIKEFRLGLSTPYKNKDGVVSADALVYPIRCCNGDFLSSNGYYNISDLTQNPIDKNGWMKGSAQPYFTHAYTSQDAIFICECVKDAWVIWQNLKDFNLLDKILVCTSTHGSAIPDAMKNESFWTRFETIYLAHDHDSAGDVMAEKLMPFIGRDAFRLKVPPHFAKPKYSVDGVLKDESEWGADWTDFFKANPGKTEFINHIQNAPLFSIRLEKASSNEELSVGRFNVAPVDINGAYLNGFMYYPIQTLVRKQEEDEYGSSFVSERYETVVVRSDKTVHKAIKSPAPKGTPDSERVIRLTDGTLIRSEPKANDYGTWKWNHIDAYINGKLKIRDIKSIFDDIYNFLKKSVWLPVKEDYTILSLTVLATYVQNIFESVPLIFLNGQAGTGKSQTGIIMSKLSCNGSVIGQVSAATAARHIDAARGFVVFDDLEGVASKGGKESQFSDLVQALKVSYNKHTAEKVWTDVKTMKTERLNFFGIKLLSNTSGADDILSTRMLRIQTLYMPDSEKGTIKKMNASDFTRIENLRQELHAWAFENCQKIEKIAQTHDEKTGRFDEIALPLRVIGSMISEECCKELEIALSKQRTVVFESNEPVEVLKEAVKNIIKDGFHRFTVTQLIMELRTLLDDNFGANMTNQIPEWQRPEWIGRQLRTLGLLDNVDLGRTTFYGKRLKVMQFNDYAINQVIEELGATIDHIKEPFDFCKGCSSCPYANSHCDFRSMRLQEEQKSKGKYS